MSRVLIQRLTWRTTTLVGCETALIFGSILAAIWVRAGAQGWGGATERGVIPKALFAALLCQTCLYFRDLYDFRLAGNRAELVARILQSLGVTSVALALLYVLLPTLIIERGVFATAALLALVLIVGWRVTFEWLSSRVGPRERLLVVGTSAAAVALARELQARTQQGIEIVGFVEVDAGQCLAAGPDLLGTIEDVPAIVRARGVDRVVVSLADARGKLPMDKLLDMKLDGVSFDHLASVYEEYTGRIALENLRPSWLIFSEGFRKSAVLQAIKRAIDITGAGLALVLSLPVLAILAVAVRVTSSGPILYTQRRVGHHGRVFMLRKFRSMRADAEADTGAVWAGENDTRVTPIGRFLRRAHLDELPQLWNVLAGDMSLVGPRPERPEFVKGLSQDIRFYGQRHVVRPGITGWAQVSYSYGSSVDDSLEKLQYDLFYIKHMSVLFDAYIVFRTIKSVLQGRGA